MFVALTVTGCRSNGNIELLERELRMQEDEIYCLENKLEQCHAMLESSRRENQAIKKDQPSSDRDAAQSSSTRTRGEASPPSLELPPGIEGPSGGETTEPPKEDAGGPVIEPGVPAGPEDLDEPQKPSTNTRGASLESDEVMDTNVTRIVLVRQLTGGRRHGRHWSDEGITVAIEPRNAGGKVVKAQGDVSIVVLDPSKSGAAARVARWDYSADEVLGHYHRMGLTRGMYFELPWPSAPPENPALHVYVRFTPTGGNKLEADMTIQVDPPDREARGWKRGTADSPPPSSLSRPFADPPTRLPKISERLERVRLLPRLRDALNTNSREYASGDPATRDFAPRDALQAEVPRRANWSPYR